MAVKSFLKDNFGTDLLLGSWLFFISTLLFTIVSAVDLYYVVEDDDSYAETFLMELLLVVSVVFLFGSYVFVELSYPDKIDAMGEKLMTTDFSKASFWERYFTGTDFLVMAWAFTIAFGIMFIYPFWGLATGEVSTELCVVFIAVLVISMTVFVIFLVSCFPENMLLNDGAGSSIVYDLFCGCCNVQFLKTHFGTDFLCAMWGIMFFAVVSVIAAIYSMVEDASSGVNIVQLIACLMFFVGSLLMVKASYPNCMKSDWSWRMLTCQPESGEELYSGPPDNRGAGGDREEPTETTKLLV
jgi:hypothetical protein